MGTVKSPGVNYGYGQFGSAFADTAANTITPPEGLAIVAIQFLADTSLSALVAKDANITINTAGAANDGGSYTRTVNGATSSSNRVVFDQENAGTDINNLADNIEVGDEIYLASTGASLGVVTGVNPDDDDTKKIGVATQSISDGVTLAFIKPNRNSKEGVGGQQLASAQVFPKGLTIYGRWDSVSINADDTDAGIIAYFGA